MQSLDETFNDCARAELKVLNFQQNLRIDESIRRRSIYDMCTHLHAYSFKPDFGTGTTSSSLLMMSSGLIPSDSAWKLVRMRWRKTGYASV